MLALFWTLLSSPAFAGLKVVATTEDLASIAQAVGGADLEVSHIARGDSDPHFVDAKPSYMVKLASADLVVAVGMDLEVGWLPSLLVGARNPRVQPGSLGYLDASVDILAIDRPTGTIDRSRGDLHPQGNPHYWLDPEGGRSVARVLSARLATLDPDHAAHYAENLAAFELRLTEKEREWAAQMAPLKGAAVIGYHSTFNYLCARYELNVIGFVEPKPGIPPTPSHTLELAAAAKAAGVRLILVEPYHGARAATPIATASGAKVVVVPTSVGGLDGVVDYFGLFDRAVALLTAP